MMKKYLLSLALLLAVNVSAQTVKNLKVETALTPSYLTQGSLTFAGSGGLLTQDNSKIFWDNTNKRLGINTNSPNSVLDVYDGTAGNGLRVTRSIVTNQYIDLIPNNGTESTLISLGGNSKPGVISNRGAFPIHFSIGGNAIANAAATITASSNLSVGTTSDLAKLGVVGTVAGTVVSVLRGASSQTANLTEWQNSAGTVLSSVVSDGFLRIGSGSFVGSSSTPAIQFGSASNGIYTDSNRIFFVSGGNFVGGFASDGYQGNYPALINSASNLTTPTLVVHRQTAAGQTSGIAGNNLGDISITTNNLSRLIATYSGNVGIGTTTPAGRLDVMNTSAATKAVVIRGAASQSANLTEWQDSSANVLGYMSATGAMKAGYGQTFGAVPTSYASFDSTLTHTNSTATNGNVVGAFNGAITYAGTSAYGNIRVGNMTAIVTNTNTSNTVRGGYFSARTSSGGAANNLIAGSSELLIGGSGAVTSGIGHEVSLIQTGAATTTAMYGIKVLDLTNSAGTITNTYGLYVGDITTGTQTNQAYSLYVSDGNARNYINGPTGFGVATVNASAQVQIDSTSKGFLPPRMTTTQRDAIASPAQGLVIFNTTTTKLECYDGTTWQAAW